MFFNLFVLRKCICTLPMILNKYYMENWLWTSMPTGSLRLSKIFTEIRRNHSVSHNVAVKTDSSLQNIKILETAMYTIKCRLDWLDLIWTSTRLFGFTVLMNYAWNTAQKMKFYDEFYENELFGKCDQIRRFLRIWSHLSEEMLNGELHLFLCSGKTATLLVVPSYVLNSLVIIHVWFYPYTWRRI